MNQKRIATFQGEFLAWLAPVFYSGIAAGLFIAFYALLKGEGKDLLMIGALIVGAVVGGGLCIILLICSFFITVRVYRNGISACAPNERRFEKVFMEWDAIKSVTEGSWLGYKTLLVESDNPKSPTGKLYIPVRLRNRAEFISLVQAYGGIANPLYQALQKLSPSGNGQEEDKMILADGMLDRYETDRPFKVRPTPNHILGWIWTVCFGGLVIHLLFNYSYEDAVIGSFFILPGPILILGMSGFYFIDNEQLIYKKTIGGAVRIAWQDVHYVDVRKQEILLYGKGLRFAMQPFDQWVGGDDSLEARLLVLRKIEEINAAQAS